MPELVSDFRLKSYSRVPACRARHSPFSLPPSIVKFQLRTDMPAIPLAASLWSVMDELDRATDKGQLEEEEKVQQNRINNCIPFCTHTVSLLNRINITLLDMNVHVSGAIRKF